MNWPILLANPGVFRPKGLFQSQYKTHRLVHASGLFIQHFPSLFLALISAYCYPAPQVASLDLDPAGLQKPEPGTGDPVSEMEAHFSRVRFLRISRTRLSADEATHVKQALNTPQWVIIETY